MYAEFTRTQMSAIGVELGSDMIGRIAIVFGNGGDMCVIIGDSPALGIEGRKGDSYPIQDLCHGTGEDMDKTSFRVSGSDLRFWVYWDDVCTRRMLVQAVVDGEEVVSWCELTGAIIPT